MAVEHTPVTSSMLQSVGYDAETQELHLTYKGGKVYVHQGVPPEAHAALMASDSLGKHVNSHIKNKYTTVSTGR